MLRKLLLPMLATAVLAGCATGYQYRGGQGDYYYGQPQVEYRYSGPGGFYGDIGLGYGSGYGFGGPGYGFGASYFYDRYGRLVYGYPSRYRSPYYGRGGGYPTRPHRGHGDGQDHQGDSDNREDRPPPWRDLGQLQQRNPDEDRYRNRGERERQGRGSRPQSFPDAPIRIERAPVAAPAARESRRSSSRMGGFIRDASGSRRTRETRVEE